MGFLDPFGDGMSVVEGGLSRPSRRHRSRSRSHKKKRSRSKSRSRSRSSSRNRDRDRGGNGIASFFGIDSNYQKHSASRGSFFNLGNEKNSSRSSFFGFSKPSYYKRSSRHGFMHKSYKQLKRLIRDLVHWAKRHPWKVFFLVLMPLISGGVLTALLARFGLRLPQSLERLVGVAGKAVTGDAGGLVGEAMKMAGSFGAGSNDSAHVRVRDARDGSLAWEKTYEKGSGGDMLGETISGVAKMFF
jgi:hypothetical protein